MQRKGKSSMRFVLTAIVVAFAAQANAAGKLGYLDAPLPDVIDSSDGLGRGHDFKRLAGAAQKLPSKGEFESSADYTERLRKASESVAYGTVKLTDRVLLTGLISSRNSQLDRLVYEYDADTMKFRVCLPSTMVQGEGTRAAVELDTTKQRLGSYVGKNAFGATARVEKSQTYFLQLALARGDRRLRAMDCLAAVDMTPEQAKAIATGSVWGIVGRVVAPFFTEAENYLGPTIKTPYEQHLVYGYVHFDVDEVIVYGPRSSQILYRATP